MVKHTPGAPTIEIIELIDDDSTGDLPRPELYPEQTPSGPRWIGVAATSALLAVIAYGVISSAITSNSTKTQPPPTTVPAPSTSVIAAAANLVSPKFYVVDPVPVGFTMHFAETLGMGGNTADFVDSSTAELWATDGATATTGSWFVVSRGTHHTSGRNAYRTVVSGIVVTVEHNSTSAQTRLAFTKVGERIEITAYGWTDRQLLRLVHSVYVADGEIRYDDPFFTSDHHKLLSTDPSSAIFGLPVAWVGYTTAVPAGLADNFTITVASDQTTDRAVALGFALERSGTISVNGSDATIGQLAADPRTTIIQWHDGERLITLRGNIDREALEQIANGVHPGDDATVRAQVDPDPPEVASVTGGELHTIASGWLDGPWIVQVSAASPNRANWFVWWIGQPGGTATPSQAQLRVAEGAGIESFVDRGRTYVLARVPRGVGDASLHVNPNGLPSVEVPFVDADASLDVVFAAYAFSEAVPFTAQVIDGTGMTVAAWPGR